MRILDVLTRRWGTLTVFYAVDVAGNERLIPVGATVLNQWRQDETQVPPWLIPQDVEGPLTWPMAVAFLRDGVPIALPYVVDNWLGDRA